MSNEQATSSKAVPKSGRPNLTIYPPVRLTYGQPSKPVKKMSPIQSQASETKKNHIDLEAQKKVMKSQLDIESAIADIDLESINCEQRLQELAMIMMVTESKSPEERSDEVNADYHKAKIYEIPFLKEKLISNRKKKETYERKLEQLSNSVMKIAEIEKEQVDLDEQQLSSDDEATVQKWDDKNARVPKGQTGQQVTEKFVMMGSTPMIRRTFNSAINKPNDESVKNDDLSDYESFEGSEEPHPGWHSGGDDTVNKLIAALSSFRGSQQVVVKSSGEKDLPTFNGKPEDWTNFKAHYDRMKKRPGVDQTDMFDKVKKAVTGEALQSVKYLFNSHTNLDAIIRSLKMEFGRPELIIETLIRQAEAVKNPNMNQPETIVEFARAVQSLVISIKGHNQKDYLNNIHLLTKLADKLPPTLRREWIMWYSANPKIGKTLSSFEEWISIQKEMACEMVKPKIPEVGTEEKKTGQRTKRGPAACASSVSDGTTNEEKFCACCDRSGHQLSKCFIFKKKPVQERAAIIKRTKLCFACLDGKHFVKDCESKRQCNKDGCKQFHHRLLHMDFKKEDKQGGEVSNPVDSSTTDNDKDKHDGVFGATFIQGASGPLGIVPVKIRGPNGIRKTYALLDSGATDSFIDEDLAKELGLEGPSSTFTVKGVFGKKTTKVIKKVNFEISGSYNSAQYSQMTDVKSTSDLGFNPYSVNVDEIKRKWPYLNKMKMKNFDNAVVRVVVGEDHGFLTMHRELLYHNDKTPVGKRTKLGWFVSGKIMNANNEGSMNHICCTDEELHELVKQSFSVDNFGVKITSASSTASIEDKKSLEILKNTYRKDSTGCEVGLLWRDPEVSLPESWKAAFYRLKEIEKRMQRDSECGESYSNKFIEYEQKGYISQATGPGTRRTWYTPHFGVFNPNKPGKLRLVFDAAAKSNGISLNDNLMKGPDLIRPLTEVLWNFRRHRYVISGDIEDMFHRIHIKPEDRASQRFLWRNGNSSVEPTIYEMNVMIFGASSSPASAIFVKNQNAEEYQDKYPEAYRVILEDFYVDDVLTGAPTKEECFKLYEDVTWINLQANFHVKKWTSNSPEILKKIPREMLASGARDFMEKSVIPTERVLGLWWDPVEDVFSFRTNFHKVKADIMQGSRPTKREMCGLVMSLFDPIGFINHYKVKGLMLLQQTWREKTGWDDEISVNVYEDWKLWITDLPSITNVKIPRCYHHQLDTATSIQLHTFADASEEGYTAVTYIRAVVNGEVSLSFVASKVRVAPLKKLTIPRLELMAALLGTRLATSIQNGLKVSFSARYFWSDSKTVLSWIKTETARFKEFVANRVGEIQEFTNSGEWKWVPTDLNVADDATRLKKAADLSSSSRWLRGPAFLLEDVNCWPVENNSEGTCCAAVVNESHTNAGISEEVEFLDSSRFSSYHRLIRVSGSVVAAGRWWKNKISRKVYIGGATELKSPWKIQDGQQLPQRDLLSTEKVYGNKLKVFLRENCVSQLSPEDIIRGEQLLVKQVQSEAFKKDMELIARVDKKERKKSRLYKLSPMIDEEGIVRIRGRIDAAVVEASVKQPIILPSDHNFTKLLILNEHEINAHQGQTTVMNNLRKRFWILQGRHAVIKNCRFCQVCMLKAAKPIIPEMGSLPHYRLASYQLPFSFTGVDYFGPMEVVVGRHREKRWGALFVCMVTRGVYLDVAHGLSTDDFMLVLSRFVDTRGRPRHIYSDNGTNFVGAAKELKEAWKTIDFERITSLRKFSEISWSRIPPASGHIGGAWERLVKTVKKALSSLVKERCPRDQTLLTAFKAAENIVNSRPLCYISSDPDDLESLTPNHFLRGGVDTGPGIPAQLDDSDEFCRKQWKVAQVLANKFWDRWTTEYLPSLVTRQKWHEAQEPIRVGDLVVVVDDQQPRNMWMKAVVTATFPGKDGQVRVVEVTTRDFKTKKTSTYRRPVTKVCPLGLRLEAGLGSPSSGAGM